MPQKVAFFFCLAVFCLPTAFHGNIRYAKRTARASFCEMDIGRRELIAWVLNSLCASEAGHELQQESRMSSFSALFLGATDRLREDLSEIPNLKPD